MNSLRQLISFIKLGRVQFSGGGFVLYGLGSVLAHYEGYAIDWRLYVWGQAIVTSTQLMTHYANDYFDYHADMLNLTPTHWSGGSRVLVRGELPIEVARYAALFLGSLALLLTVLLPLFFSVGLLALPIILSAIGLSWIYSAPPLRVNARGWGELTATIVVAILTPLTGYYLQSQHFHLTTLLSLAPLILLQFNMLFSVNLPDIEGDLQADKFTWVAQLGRANVAKIYVRNLWGVPLSLPILWLLGMPLPALVGVMIPFPLGLYLIWRMRRGDWQNPVAWDSLAFQTIALLMGTAVSMLIMFLVLGE